MVTQKDRRLLGARVRKHRQRARLTMEKLAEKADFNPVYIGQIERGYKMPTIGALLRIAKALDVRIRDLVRDL